MAWDGATFMDGDDHILVRRLAEYVQPYSEKVLARTIGCTERTAKHFRNGTSWPSARHWRMIVRAFGRDVIACVFEPEINDTLARLRREEAQLEERLDEIRRRRRSAAGGLPEHQERREPASDRSPLDRDLPFEEPRTFARSD
jgi:predicted transcriptional regulator